MSAFFFGTPEKRLFGYHHAPRKTSIGAVVICPAWGLEYQFAHRALRVLADRLAASGFHVLRFDYTGTGDSWGTAANGDVSQWGLDLDRAIDEIKTLSGKSTVDLIGIRIGASIAAAVDRADIGAIVLWDPIVDGAAWVRELRSRAGEPVPPTDAESGSSWMASPELVSQLQSLELKNPAGTAERVLLLETADQPSGRTAMSRLQWTGNVEHEVLEDVSAWIEDVAIWSGQVPANVVNRIVKWLARDRSNRS